MKKIIINITYFIVLILFLLNSIGVLVIKHHCNIDNTTDIHFFSKEACSEAHMHKEKSHHKINTKNSVNFIEIIDIDEDCC